MMFRAAVALFVLAAPAFAQHGVAHAGSFGSRGFAGHVGVSGHLRFLTLGQLCAASRRRFDTAHWVTRDFSVLARPYYSSPRFPHSGNRFMAYRLPYQPGLRTRPMPGTGMVIALLPRSETPIQQLVYVIAYPAWLGYGYPYVIDPGFYDWGDSENLRMTKAVRLPLTRRPTRPGLRSARGDSRAGLTPKRFRPGVGQVSKPLRQDQRLLHARIRAASHGDLQRRTCSCEDAKLHDDCKGPHRS